MLSHYLVYERKRGKRKILVVSVKLYSEKRTVYEMRRKLYSEKRSELCVGGERERSE